MWDLMFGARLPNIQLQGMLSGTKSKAKQDNMIQFIEMFNRFANLAMTRFNWRNLPSGFNERFINMCMFFYGSVAVFEHPILGLTALPYQWNGEPNIFYEPISIRPFSIGYEGPELSIGEFEIIRNNPTCTPTMFATTVYCERLADILRTLDTALLRKKHPWGITADEKEVLTIKNFFKEVADNEPLLIGMKNFDRGRDSNRMIEFMNMEDNTDLQELWLTFNNFLCYLYTLFGIENNNQEKKERLILDEVNANNMVTDLNLEIQLKEYREGIRRVNEHWGTTIEVEATDIQAYKEGGFADGTFYDGAGEASGDGI